MKQYENILAAGENFVQKLLNYAKKNNLVIKKNKKKFQQFKKITNGLQHLK